MPPRPPRPFQLLVIALLLAGAASAQKKQEEGGYDPLAVAKDVEIARHELVVKDEKRDREIPVLVYLDAKAAKAAPVVLFSHGLGGTRQACSYLGRHWASRGYVAVFLQHPGSDDSVWKDEAPLRRRSAMDQAANGQNARLRFEDVPAVLDRLEVWNDEAKHVLHGRLDLKHVGMSGHSFGARTTQALAGQRFGRLRHRALFADRRIDAAIALSPSAPQGGDPKAAFGEVRLPWLLMTGTEDVSPIGDSDVENRLSVFPALPRGGKYELVLDGARHEAFGDERKGALAKRNPNHHRAIMAISTAFWDAWLKEDPAARRWLDGDGPRSVLEEKDRWQTKLDREP